MRLRCLWEAGVATLSTMSLLSCRISWAVVWMTTQKIADVQNLLKEAGASVDPELRRKAYSEAIRLATERVDFVPLFSAVRYVAFSKQLRFQGFADDLPRFYLSTWK